MPTVKVTIELRIRGDEIDVSTVVDGVLDNAALQDAIHEYAEDLGYGAKVKSAIVTRCRQLKTRPKPAPAPRPPVPEIHCPCHGCLGGCAAGHCPRTQSCQKRYGVCDSCGKTTVDGTCRECGCRTTPNPET